MKYLLTCLAMFVSVWASAQNDTGFVPKLTVKFAPLGLTLGNVVLQGEYNIGGRQSLTAKFGFPRNTSQTLTYDNNDAEFDMKAMSFLAGYRMYFSPTRHMKGLYWEPFFQYIHHSSEGLSASNLDFREVNMRFSNDFSSAGVGVQLGMQFLVKKRFVIDLFFLGPHISSARNNMKAVEYGYPLPWTPQEKEEAEQQLREFLDQFPIIPDRTVIGVNSSNKTITADFKGRLPGIRAGVSVGYAF